MEMFNLMQLAKVTLEIIVTDVRQDADSLVI